MNRPLNDEEKEIFANAILALMSTGMTEDFAMAYLDRLIIETGHDNYEHVMALLKDIGNPDGGWQKIH